MKRDNTPLVRDATFLFDPGEVLRLSSVGYKSREKLISMNIQDFLDMAKQGHSEYKLHDVIEVFRQGVAFRDVPFLIAYQNEAGDLAVSGHEGRHRARVLQMQGFTHMPVNLISSIRWSEQNDPNRFDYVENWPLSLLSEDGARRMDFPVSRQEAGQAYRPAGMETGLRGEVGFALAQKARQDLEDQIARKSVTVTP